MTLVSWLKSKFFDMAPKVLLDMPSAFLFSLFSYYPYWKWIVNCLHACSVTSVLSDSVTLGSSVHGILQEEYCIELPCPSPGDLPDPGIEPTSPTSPALQVDSLPTELPGKPNMVYICAKCISSHFSLVQLFVTLWTEAPQGSSVHGILRQEYWSGLPFPPPGGLPDPGIKSRSLMSPALAGKFFTTSITWEAPTLSTVSPKYWCIKCWCI